MVKNNLNQLTGKRFGKLIVLGRAECNSKSGNAMWICRCDCGNETTVIGSHLRSGHTTSCGCNRISEIAQGHASERIYRTWKKMHKRCSDPKSDRYKWYGGKGVNVCEEWNDFLAFREWAMNHGYTDELTIDRIDSNGNYCPENCQWVGMKAQANNRSNNHIICYEGNKYTVVQLAEKHGLSPTTIYNRLKLNWNIDRIITTPERGFV